jgi:predicted site-specific integrase-resolvase
MGQVRTHPSFQQEPIEQAPEFGLHRGEVLTLLGISIRTLSRWEHDGRIWPYDPVRAPDGHYVTLPSGRRRYSASRIRTYVRT